MHDGGHGADQPRNRWTGSVSPVMSMPASDPSKMRLGRDLVVAVTVTSAGAGGAFAARDYCWPSPFGQVARTVEPEVPVGSSVVVGGEVDGR